MKNVFNSLLLLPLLFLISCQPPTSSSADRIYRVVKGDLISKITISGKIIPDRAAYITAPYSGHVKKIFVKLGQEVNKNDPLVSITQTLLKEEEVFPLRAPFSGLIVQMNKNEGEFVNQGNQQDFILRIDDLEKRYFYAKVPEIDQVKLQLSQEALIKISALPEKTYQGKLVQLSLAAGEAVNPWENNTPEFPCKILLQDADGQVKSGMSAIADIIILKKENILLVPHEYLYREKGKYFVVLANKEKREVKVGVQNESHFEVQDNLQEGELLRPIDYLELNQEDL